MVLTHEMAQRIEHWAVYARGPELVTKPQSASQSGFVMGLLRTQSDGAKHYALGIGFQNRVLSFFAPAIASKLKVNVYPNRTSYDLTQETGKAGKPASSVEFLSVDPAYQFNLLLPEEKIPPTSRGKIRSLVTIGT